MENKEIYIDGVDVSKCEHAYISTSLFKEKTYVQCSAFFLENEDDYCDCTDNTNCYYKQLKRKEQECEELKKQRQADKGLITATGKENYQLLQEYDKLKTALTEIKEIAEVNSINTCWTAINLCVDCDEIKECGLQSPFEKLKAIIQKISECEGNDE